jgi:hypothetical protein
MIDTDALLAPAMTAPDEVQALRDVIAANTAAFKEIRIALDTCNNVDKVRAVIDDVEKAMQDLSLTSQKVDVALNKPTPQQQQQAQAGGGQYPINQPFNPDNPVPWPPEYDAPIPPTDLIEQLKYQYYQQGNNNPPAGFCYQSAPDTISFNYKDNDANNNMTLFQLLAVGDTIAVSDTLWTITAIPQHVPGGSVFTYTVSPANFASPYGLLLFTFDHSETPSTHKGGKK